MIYTCLSAVIGLLIFALLASPAEVETKATEIVSFIVLGAIATFLLVYFVYLSLSPYLAYLEDQKEFDKRFEADRLAHQHAMREASERSEAHLTEILERLNETEARKVQSDQKAADLQAERDAKAATVDDIAEALKILARSGREPTAAQDAWSKRRCDAWLEHARQVVKLCLRSTQVQDFEQKISSVRIPDPTGAAMQQVRECVSWLQGWDGNKLLERYSRPDCKLRELTAAIESIA